MNERIPRMKVAWTSWCGGFVASLGKQDSVILSTWLPSLRSSWGLRWWLELHPSHLLLSGQKEEERKGKWEGCFHTLTILRGSEVFHNISASELTFPVTCSHKRARIYSLLAGWQYVQLKVGVLLLRIKDIRRYWGATGILLHKEKTPR